MEMLQILLIKLSPAIYGVNRSIASKVNRLISQLLSQLYVMFQESWIASAVGASKVLSRETIVVFVNLYHYQLSVRIFGRKERHIENTALFFFQVSLQQSYCVLIQGRLNFYAN